MEGNRTQSHVAPKKKLVYTQLYKTPPKLPPLNRHQGEQKNGLNLYFFKRCKPFFFPELNKTPSFCITLRAKTKWAFCTIRTP